MTYGKAPSPQKPRIPRCEPRFASPRCRRQTAEPAEAGLQPARHHFDIWRQFSLRPSLYMVGAHSETASFDRNRDNYALLAARVPPRVPHSPDFDLYSIFGVPWMLLSKKSPPLARTMCRTTRRGRIPPAHPLAIDPHHENRVKMLIWRAVCRGAG